MLEDTVLIWKFKSGSGEALSRIYQKYKIDLLRLATILLNDTGDAEDVVHDVFLSFAQYQEIDHEKSKNKICRRGSDNHGNYIVSQPF